MEKKISIKPGLLPQAKLVQAQVPLARIIPIQKLIQLSQAEFVSRIEKTVSENPFLEKEEFASSGSTLTGERGVAGDNYITSRHMQAGGKYGTQSTQSAQGDDGAGNLLEEINADTSQSLTGNLLEQIKWLNLTPKDGKIALALLSLLDEDGFLSEAAIVSVNEVVKQLDDKAIKDEKLIASASRSGNESKVGEVEKVLGYLQENLDPAGVLARSLPEALSLMLSRKGYRKGDLPVRIIEEGFDTLSKKDYAKLKKQLEVSSRALKEAIEVINSLDPYLLRNQPSSMDANVIIPDVIIREREEVLEVEVNREYIPQIRLLKDLMEKAVQQGKQTASSQTPEISKKEESADKSQGNDFVLEKRNEALNLMSAITFRESNLKKIMDYLVQEQYDFFLKGFVKLKPMRIIDIAQELKIDKASISRLVNRKYVATYWGAFALREMFSLPVDVGRETPVSPKEIQAKIKQLQVEFQDQKLSDQKIANMLVELGYQVARRTVNKYRKLIEAE